MADTFNASARALWMLVFAAAIHVAHTSPWTSVNGCTPPPTLVLGALQLAGPSATGPSAQDEWWTSMNAFRTNCLAEVNPDGKVCERRGSVCVCVFCTQLATHVSVLPRSYLQHDDHLHRYLHSPPSSGRRRRTCNR